MEKLLEIAGDNLVNYLAAGKSLEILDDELLAIKLRAQTFRPEDKEIKNNPLCHATSAELAKNGKKVFWLLTGGLMESSLKLSHASNLGNAPVKLGFSANSLLDYHSFQPYTYEPPDLLEDFLARHSTELPLDAKRANSLLPGATFQLLGKATAKLSSGLSSTQGMANVSVGADGTVTGEFALRISRDEKNMVTVAISQILDRTFSSSTKATLGWSMDTGKIYDHKWFKKGQESLNSLDLDYVTGAIPGWEGDTKLGDYIKDKGDESLAKILTNYSSFYFQLGHKTSYSNRSLIKFILDLSTKEGRAAYDHLCHFNEEKAAELAGKIGVERIEFKEYKTGHESSSELGFPGKKILLSHTLRAMREGFLIYDNHLQVMELETLGQKTGFFNNNQQLTWEGLHVQVDGENKGRAYWRFNFIRQDAYTSKNEIIHFARFAGLFDIAPIEEAQIESYPWYKKLFTHKDNTDFQADIFFTEAGLAKLPFVPKTEIRKAVCLCAEALGYIPAGLMFDNNAVRQLLRDYLALGLEYDDDQKREEIEQKYLQITSQQRPIRQDALTIKKAALLSDHLAMLQHKDPKEWNNIFIKLGEAVRSDFMVIIAALCRLVGQDETFVSSLEIKRKKNGKVLLTAKEKGEIMSGDEMFNNAQKAVINAKA